MTRRCLRASLLSLLLTAAACGGGGGSQPFSQCGNGALDAGELCDPGFICVGGPDAGRFCSHSSDCSSGGNCSVNDSGACLSTCVPASCGDGYVHRDVEQCDGDNFAGRSCASLGLAGDGLACTDDCRFDTSACGAQLPPTATATVTATPTPARTATPTPPQGCGNGSIDEGETCDDGNTNDGDQCPSDCSIAACTPSGDTVDVVVAFDSPDAALTSLAILLNYPDGSVSIPGKRNEASVLARVVFAPGYTGGRNDLDYQLLMTPRLSPAAGSGSVATITFDLCVGTSLPEIDAFGCRVTSTSPSTQGVTCQAAFR